MSSDDDQAHLGVLLARALEQMADDVARQLATCGFGDLAPMHGPAVLEFVGDHGRRVTELAQLAGISKQAMSQNVASLERRGYVTVAVDPSDSRARRVRLTARGRDARAAAAPLFARVDAQWRDRYGDELIERMKLDLAVIVGGVAPDED